MSAEKSEIIPTIDHKPHAAFFRQSGWMMISAVASGVLMYCIHPIVSRVLSKEEYGVVTTLMQIVAMMGIPASGLQPVIAQQAAAAVSGQQQRIVASEFRAVWQAIFFIWLALAALTFALWPQVMAALKIRNPATLAITVVISLVAMWTPLVTGILQGRQNFFWLGWTSIVNGLGRFLLVFILVWFFHGWSASVMNAVFFGMLALLVISLGQIRDVWKTERVPVEWKNWLGRVIPLTLGLGAASFMLSADMLFTQKYFPADQTAFYGAAGIIGRALVFFTQPLTVVMFPKLARASVTNEKSNALVLTLGATVFAGMCAAIACSVVPWLPLRVMYDKSFLVAAPLVPWFAWCMLPLTLSNVLVNSLMARAKFSAVPWLVLVAIGYGVALAIVGRHAANLTDTQAGLKMMIQTLGVFNLLLFGVCAWFVWGKKSKA